MPRKPTGQVVEPTGGRSWSIRFSANGKRRSESLPEGSTREDAERLLRHRLVDVERGEYESPRAAATPRKMPTFHEWATDWLRDREPEVRDTTLRQYEEDLKHLLPYFRDYELDAIQKTDVDAYRRSKLREAKRRAAAIEAGKPERFSNGMVKKPLSNNSVNRTIQRLAQVLEDAVEADLIDRNPAKGRKRRAKRSAVNRASLTSAQVPILLEAAAELDERRKRRDFSDPGQRRAMVATLVLAGLRIGELSALKWRDVDLASGKLHVRESKTDTGVRVVDLMPDLQEALTELRTRSTYTRPEHFVFCTKTGKRTKHSTIRGRVWTVYDEDGEAVRIERRGILAPAVERANELLQEREMDVEPLPQELTPHGLRRTYAGLLFEAGGNVPYVMAQMGHKKPEVTLSIYAKVVRDQVDVRDRFDQLLRPDEKATKRQREPKQPEEAPTKKRSSGSESRSAA